MNGMCKDHHKCNHRVHSYKVVSLTMLVLQVIALVAYLVQERRPAGPFMVVAPASLIANWEQEFQQWAPSLKLVSYKGSADARAGLFTQQVRFYLFHQ